MADTTDVGGGTDFSIAFDKSSLKSIKSMGTTIGSMNKGVTKFQNALSKVAASQSAFSASITTLLKAQLKVQQGMAKNLNIMAKNAQKQNQLYAQLLKVQKPGVANAPSKALLGILPAMTNWKKLQNNFQAMVKNLYSMLPKQIQGYLRSLQTSLKSHLSQAWSKMSSSQQAVLKKAWSRMEKFATDSYNNAFKVVAKGLSLANKANKIGEDRLDAFLERRCGNKLNPDNETYQKECLEAALQEFYDSIEPKG